MNTCNEAISSSNSPGFEESSPLNKELKRFHISRKTKEHNIKNMLLKHEKRTLLPTNSIFEFLFD